MLGWRKKADSEAKSQMVQADEREGEKAPEDERMGEPRQRTLLDHLALAEDLPEEVPDPAPDRMQGEVDIFSRAENRSEDWTEAPEEETGGDENACHEQYALKRRKASGLGQGRRRASIRSGKGESHPRTSGYMPPTEAPQQPSEPVRERNVLRRSTRSFEQSSEAAELARPKRSLSS